MRDPSELTDLPDEDELPMMAAHHIDATRVRMTWAKAAACSPPGPRRCGQARQAGEGRNQPAGPQDLGQGRPQRLLPCGSGKRYKHCHGLCIGLKAPGSPGPSVNSSQGRRCIQRLMCG